MTDITFPSVLKSERQRIGWTRRKMSETTGIPEPTIISWEKGTEPPAYIKRYVLAELRQINRPSNDLFEAINELRQDIREGFDKMSDDINRRRM